MHSQHAPDAFAPLFDRIDDGAAFGVEADGYGEADDGSGDLDHEEFTEAMNRLGLGLTPDQIIQCIEVLDVDGDGEVSLEEFMVLVREPVKKAVKVIAAASAFTSAGKTAEAKRAF